MNTLTLTVLFIFSYCIGFSQNQACIDSLKHQLDNEQQDTNRVVIMLKLYDAFLDRELTDINKLADEYLRLSYHGLRATNKLVYNNNVNPMWLEDGRFWDYFVKHLLGAEPPKEFKIKME